MLAMPRSSPGSALTVGPAHSYALQNDCGLMFGESTASAIFRADPVGTAGGKALMCINELTRIASERTCSAREAVKLIGELGERYGFYGPDGGSWSQPPPSRKPESSPRERASVMGGWMVGGCTARASAGLVAASHAGLHALVRSSDGGRRGVWQVRARCSP